MAAQPGAGTRRTANMALGVKLYNVFAKRNSTFIATIIGTAFVAEYLLDKGVDTFWRYANRGVSAVRGCAHAHARVYGGRGATAHWYTGEE